MVIKKVELCIEKELTFGESKLTMNSKKVKGEFFRIFPIKRGSKGESFAELNGKILSKVLSLHFYQHSNGVC